MPTPVYHNAVRGQCWLGLTYHLFSVGGLLTRCTQPSVSPSVLCLCHLPNVLTHIVLMSHLTAAGWHCDASQLACLLTCARISRDSCYLLSHGRLTYLRYDTVYLTCSKKLTRSSLAHHTHKKKVKECIVLCEIHLRTTGCHLSMGSHSVICHPTEVTAPPSSQPGRLVLDLSTP